MLATSSSDDSSVVPQAKIRKWGAISSEGRIVVEIEDKVALDHFIEYLRGEEKMMSQVENVLEQMQPVTQDHLLDLEIDELCQDRRARYLDLGRHLRKTGTFLHTLDWVHRVSADERQTLLSLDSISILTGIMYSIYNYGNDHWKSLSLYMDGCMNLMQECAVRQTKLLRAAHPRMTLEKATQYTRKFPSSYIRSLVEGKCEKVESLTSLLMRGVVPDEEVKVVQSVRMTFSCDSHLISIEDSIYPYSMNDGIFYCDINPDVMKNTANYILNSASSQKLEETVFARLVDSSYVDRDLEAFLFIEEAFGSHLTAYIATSYWLSATFSGDDWESACSKRFGEAWVGSVKRLIQGESKDVNIADTNSQQASERNSPIREN